MNPRFPDLAVAAGTGRDATHDAAKPRAPRGIDRGGVSRWHERESATAGSRRRSTHHRRVWDVLTTTLPATFFFAGSLFKAPRGPLNARREDSASDARHVTGVAEVTDVPGIETSGRRAPCNAVNRGGHGGVGKVLERIESHCEKSLATTDTRKSRARYYVFGFCRHSRPERRARVTSGGALLSARRCASSRGSESFPRVWPRDGLRGGPGSRCSP